MPTATISASQVGAYEIALTANTEATVDVAITGAYSPISLEVTVHTGNSPVYFRAGGAAVTAKDPTAQMAVAGSSLLLRATTAFSDTTTTVHLISSAAAVVSVARA